MNAALEQVESLEHEVGSEMSAVAENRTAAAKLEAKRQARRERRKSNEIKRRFVLTLTAAETEWVHANYERLGFDSAPALLRHMAFTGLASVGEPSGKRIEIMHRENELARLRAEEEQGS